MEKVYPAKTECKLYRRRWLMLAIFFCFSVGNVYQWIQYSIISNIITKYYDVPTVAVDFTSMIFMIVFIPFIFPASRLLDKKGMKVPMIIGTFLTALGACIKLLSVSPDRFWVTFVGQTSVALGQLFLLSVPPTLAAIWFGEKEVSTACAIGTIGNQLGIVMGFLIPPMVVHDHDNIDDIGDELMLIFICSAAFNSFIFLCTVFLFEARPPLPPSPQQALQWENSANNVDGGFRGFIKLMKRLLCYRDFMFLLFAYSFNQAVLNSVSTLLNQVILNYFEDEVEFAGYVGVVFVAGGILGGFIFGPILDRTRKYKLVSCIMYALSALGMLGFTFILKTKSQVLVYIVTAVFGVFLEGYMPVGYDYAAEITYPEPEAMTAGLLTFAIQIISTAATYSYGELVRSFGPEEANHFLTGILVLGTILKLIMKPTYKRQEAAKDKNTAQP